MPGLGPDKLHAVALLLVSPFVGSFLALAADRLPVGRPILVGRSQCDSCGRKLDLLDLVPVLSWLATGGRCRTCNAEIPVLLPVLELAAVAVALTAIAVAPGMWMAVTALFGWALLLLGILDLRDYWLPLPITIALAAAGLFVGLGADTFTDSLIGLAVGFLLLEGLRLFYRLAAGRDGIGGGDPVLLGAVGAWVGWQGLAAVLLLASIGAIAAVLLLALVRQARPSRHDRVPLGSWIAVSAFAVWCIGPAV